MSTAANPCLEPFEHRGITFKNRVGLAPLTRGRASYPEGCVNDLHVKYYTQRSSGGFILSEATGISRRGNGWYKAPGIYTDEQVAAWKIVTDAVHKEGGKMFCQLWHMGRAGHSDLFGDVPLSASALPLTGEVTVENHVKKPYETPKAMTDEDISATLAEYKNAAKCAVAAGFDGVQIHSANGYLLDQFIQTCTNKREDKYGGALENRLRFLKEVIEAVLTECPAEKTMIRFSPNGAFQEMGGADNLETFDAAIQAAAGYKLLAVEVMDGLTFGYHEKCDPYTLERTRKNVNIGNPDGSTAVMGNCGHTQETANKEIGAGNADLISIGRDYMSNPDLPERFRDGLPLAPQPEYPDWWTYEDAQGYTTFPKATPTLYYFSPFAGRAELVRLVCKAGALELEECHEKPTDVAAYASSGSLPLFTHNTLKMAQSGAIEMYCASIAPNFASLSATQRAKDQMFACIKEDALVAVATPMFGDKNKDVLTAAFDKYLGIIEAYLPAEGFVNGESFPTMADLAVVNICTSHMPYGAGLKVADYDYKKFAKVAALVDLTLGHKNLEGYAVNGISAFGI